MRRFIFWLIAAGFISSPALARDNSGYIGVDGGILFPRDMHSDLRVVYPTTTAMGVPSGVKAYAGGIDYNLKSGYDVDLVGGYDFGLVRLEGELGYKHTHVDSISLSSTLLGDLTVAAALPTPLRSGDIDLVSPRTTVLSGMLNGLLDFDMGDRFGGSVGAGFGRAHVKRLTGSDNAWAWQIIAGVHTALSGNIDVGLKYRYFRTGNLHISGEFDFGTTNEFPYTTSDRFQSNSLMLSLAYNFAGVAPPPPAVPPPPPPPPTPATQTCADGSVVPVTSICPPPPASPPAPPPPPTSGERG